MSVYNMILLFATIHGVLSVRQGLLFRLDGSNTSYIIFPNWLSCANGSVEFEFETKRSTALLLYLDNRDASLFLEMKLVRGSIRFRYRYKTTDVLQTIDDGLNDGKWHKVTVTSTLQGFQVSIGTLSQLIAIDGYYEEASRSQTFATGTYFGGLPAFFQRNALNLSLPSSAYEPHFHGSVRDFSMSQCGQSLESVDMLTGSGVRSGVDDPCTVHDPCQHGGACINTDLGPVCECGSTGFVGTHCSTGKISLTFSD